MWLQLKSTWTWNSLTWTVCMGQVYWVQTMDVTSEDKFLHHWVLINVCLIGPKHKSSHSPFSLNFTTLVPTTITWFDTVSWREACSLWDTPADKSGLTVLCEAVRRDFYPETRGVKFTEASKRKTGTTAILPSK